MKPLQKGFTLVELLIVIVVIAILASISVVAYNGVQQRSYASAAATTVDSYLKLIEMYKVENGEYPPTSTGFAVCLSSAGSLTAEGEFDEGVCYMKNGVAEASVSEDFNNQISTFTPSLPNGKLPAISGGGESARGLVYIPAGPNAAYVRYALKGDYDCPRGEKDPDYSSMGYTACTITLGIHFSSGQPI